eukprot:scaffold5866_cov93-Isochrysis_galbana.AAC.9
MAWAVKTGPSRESQKVLNPEWKRRRVRSQVARRGVREGRGSAARDTEGRMPDRKPHRDALVLVEVRLVVHGEVLLHITEPQEEGGVRADRGSVRRHEEHVLRGQPPRDGTAVAVDASHLGPVRPTAGSPTVATGVAPIQVSARRAHLEEAAR